jgi:hypothetical protein
MPAISARKAPRTAFGDAAGNNASAALRTASICWVMVYAQEFPNVTRAPRVASATGRAQHAWVSEENTHGSAAVG